MQIVILGSTGSIGQNTIKVIQHLNQLNNTRNHFQIRGLVAHQNWKLLKSQIKDTKPLTSVLMDRNSADTLKRHFKNSSTKISQGLNQAERLVTDPAVKVIVVAISGAEALSLTRSAIRAGKTLALANKEVMVMAGELLIREAKRYKATIRPVDSEHSAIFQALHCGKPGEVKRVILTASGGPFYRYPMVKLDKITPSQALKHPTWQMGPKITIDSATLMNKALEIIEAHWLFNLSSNQIKVLIHPQSIVHSLVEFTDGSVIAQMGQPDMRTPIQFALTYPQRYPAPDGLWLGRNLSTLTFAEPDKNRFPALRLGYETIRRGGTAGAVLNAADEEAVKLFLQKRIRFTDIIPLVKKVFNQHRVIVHPTFTEIMESDRWAREQVKKNCNHIPPRRKQITPLPQGEREG